MSVQAPLSNELGCLHLSKAAHVVHMKSQNFAMRFVVLPYMLQLPRTLRHTQYILSVYIAMTPVNPGNLKQPEETVP